jgi:hypothetical protein
MVTAVSFSSLKAFDLFSGPTVAHMSATWGQWMEAMRNLLDYLLVLTVRFGAGSALVMVKNLWP